MVVNARPDCLVAYVAKPLVNDRRVHTVSRKEGRREDERKCESLHQARPA